MPINDRMHRACSHLKVSERTVVHEGDAVVGGIVYCNCKPFTRGISFDSSNAAHKMRTLYIIQIIATILMLLKIKAVIEIIACFLGQLSSFISTSPSIRDFAILENITLSFLALFVIFIKFSEYFGVVSPNFAHFVFINFEFWNLKVN